MDKSIQPFFSPHSIVLVGASHDPTKLGYSLARNLVLSGFPGRIYLINPRGGELFGKKVYPGVSDVPENVELAVLLVPPSNVPAILKECAGKGVKGAIIVTGGFRETGPEGAALEEECARIAADAGMRLIGPNCVGVIHTHLPVDTTFLQPPTPAPGEVAFVSHSGAICGAVVDWLRGQGINLSHLLSLGNQVDVRETDVLAPLAADPHTSVITMYLESIQTGRRFMEEAERAVRIKPVIAHKVGRSASGQKAASSHTGALAGSETAYDAAFRRAGVLRADSTEQMFIWARALAWCPLPKGKNVAVLTNAGGPGVTASDAVDANGLALAELSDETRGKLRAILPAAASVRNPVDMLASASPEIYAGCLKMILEDPGVDSAMVITPPPPAFTTGAVARALIPIIQVTEKPVVVAFMGDKLISEGVEILRAVHIPEYRFPEQAASALGALYHRAQFLAAPNNLLEPQKRIPRRKIHDLRSIQPDGGWLESGLLTGLFADYGVETLRTPLAKTADEAISLARKIGYPLVLKIASPDISHKSDVGGVVLNIENAHQLRKAFIETIRHVADLRPDARIDGATLQKMLPPGQEVIVGMTRDPQFGPMLMFGSGGVEVEGLKDVAFALAPLTETNAQTMLQTTWAGRKLNGYRNIPTGDREAVLSVLASLSRMVMDHPEIKEIEINPLRVFEPGSGACAVDLRARLE
jgi:acetyltransferase